jgi:sugar phosphate isomerase/epimerase
MNAISFMTANYVARQLGYHMTEGWGQGDKSTQDYFKPIATFAKRFETYVADVRALGFESVDIWLAILHPAWATPDHVSAARDLLARYKLPVVSLAGGFGATRGEFEATCKLAVALNTTILGGSTPLLFNDRAFVVGALKQHGLKLGIENHPEKTPEELLDKIGDGGDGAIGAAVDTGWFGTHGYDAAQALKRIGKRLFYVHLKDVLKPGGHETCRYGLGCVPIETCVRTLREIAYTGAISVGARTRSHDPQRTAKRIWPYSRMVSAMSKKSKMGAAIVGCGNIADRYAENLATYAETELVGVTDIDTARAKKFARKFKFRAFPTLDDLLAEKGIGVAVNLTSHFAHVEITTRCLQAGKHVFSEKPLATTYADATRLVKLAKKKGLRLGCAPYTLMGEGQQTAWKYSRGHLGNGSGRLRRGELGKDRILASRAGALLPGGRAVRRGRLSADDSDLDVWPGETGHLVRYGAPPRSGDEGRRGIPYRRAGLGRVVDRAAERHARPADDRFLRGADQADRNRVSRGQGFAVSLQLAQLRRRGSVHAVRRPVQGHPVAQRALQGR